MVEDATVTEAHEALKGTVERITNPRTVSAFKEKGVLSINEFDLAGDNIVSKCPTWSWESGEPSKRKPYLPAEKQFLNPDHQEWYLFLFLKYVASVTPTIEYDYTMDFELGSSRT